MDIRHGDADVVPPEVVNPTSMSETRDSLAFRREAEAAFEFLRRELGLRLTTAEETFLRYESDAVFVNVYHGRSSYELRFEIGLLANPQSKYYPEELVALRGVGDEAFFQASSAERVKQYVPRLAGLLRTYAGALLAGDQAEFERLQEVRDRLATAVTHRYFASGMREKADVAWKRGDYAALVDALSAISNDLSPAEERKLAFALEKLGRVQ